MAPEMFDRRILVVSGKGGTGKTTVAAACAAAAARTGRRVLVVEVEGHHGMSRLLGILPPGFRERPAPLGFAVLEITPREALLEYLSLIAGLRGVSGTLGRARVVETATEAVPGFRDVMVAGKLYELTEWREGHPKGTRRPYDLVVVDAPPTGRLVPFLRAPAAYRELIRIGRAARQLARIDRLIRERTRVTLVAVPEEMALVETVEAMHALEELGMAHGPIVVNRILPPAFPPGTRAAGLRLTPASLREALAESGAASSAVEAEELLEAARARDRRVRAQRRTIQRLAGAGPVVELPFLFAEPFGRDQVEALGGLLAGDEAHSGGPAGPSRAGVPR